MKLITNKIVFQCEFKLEGRSRTFTVTYLKRGSEEVATAKGMKSRWSAEVSIDLVPTHMATFTFTGYPNRTWTQRFIRSAISHEKKQS